MKLYRGNKGYSWDGDHDPIIDRMMDMREKEGLSNSEISQLTGLTVGTIHNWLDRKKRPGSKRRLVSRPMFSSVMSFIRGTGHEMQIVKATRRVPASNSVKLMRNVAAKADVHNNHSGNTTAH